MCIQTVTRSSIWDRDRWPCNTPADMERALREYRDAEEEAEHEGTDSEERDENERDRRGRIYSQNKAIDQGMRAIRHEHPKHWHLLKGYYIWELWKDVNRGWHETAKMMGWDVPQCERSLRCRTANDHRYGLELCSGQDCPAVKDRFLEVNSAAVETLLHAVQRRY